MMGFRKTIGLAAALCLAILVAAPATGTDDSRQSASFFFDRTKPRKSSGALESIDYVNPSDPQAKPPAVRRVVIEAARGARWDTSVPDRCVASDAELMTLGEAACPPGSKVGDGQVSVDTGLPGPARFIQVDVDFFNNTGQLIFLNTERASGARTVIRGVVNGRRIVTDVTTLPGTPPDGGAIDTVHIHDPAISSGRRHHRRAYLRTPRRCPRSRHWTNAITFAYGDGVAQTVTTASPCRPRKAR
jgi:hypothetical protein